ncbi:hypothetical protein NM208_g5882 [Fusarium decemcellulare]|uniref:Uncharacterized protein n=1 Tax=Fusarium decemcellulare TaxID=57161 RepID=A0ACC1SFK3_9HYPO|nr:hypothetical protein NM208_g5882 [Fusarium decemcellulare]
MAASFRFILLALYTISSFFHLGSCQEAIFHQSDVVVYGNTVAALAAAIQTTRMNKTVALVFPGDRIGGLTTSGLGWTDSKDGNTIGGIAREFYSKVYEYYEDDDAWTLESRDDYLAKNIRAQPGPAIDTDKKVQWTFEPKVAEEIWEKWVKDEGIPVFRNESIVRTSRGVEKDGTDIKSFNTQSGSTFSGKIFIDGGYEGDLMETAGIPYRVGRESEHEYDEWAAGIFINGPNLLSTVDPYIEEGDPDSGLIHGVGRVIRDRERTFGRKDMRLQAFNYRLSLTQEDDNKVEFFKPRGYNETEYEILFRYIKAGYFGPFFTAQLMPNLKTDTNAAGQVSTDLIGGNYNKTSNFAEYSYEERQACAERHKLWAQGLLWTLANHDDIPEDIRLNTSLWGYAKDEWVDNDYWPYEIYIREGRRMDGMYSMTQADIQAPKEYDNDTIVAVGYYTLDVHQVERVVIDHRIFDEGLIHVPNPGPFNIPFGSIIPSANDATNFLNPVTLSATHIALSAIRMEPVYMILGQSAATAAVMALEQGVNVQDIDRKKFKEQLEGDSQVLKSSCTKLRLTYLHWIAAFFTIYMYYVI